MTEQWEALPSPLDTTAQLVWSNAEGPSEFDPNVTVPVGTLGVAAVSVTVATQCVARPTGNDAGVQTTVVVVVSAALAWAAAVSSRKLASRAASSTRLVRVDSSAPNPYFGLLTRGSSP